MSDKRTEEGFLHSIGHKLADAVFPEDSKVSKAPEAKSAAKEVKIGNGDTSAISEPIDPKIWETLIHALKEKGSLYIQFMDMVESFRAIIADEGQRYKAALVAMQKVSTGFSVDAISKALDERTQALEGERQKFLKTLDTQTAHIAEMEKTASAKTEQIESLRKQIAKLEEEKNVIGIMISQEGEKFTKIQQTFESVLSEVQKEIFESKTVIQKHLK